MEHGALVIQKISWDEQSSTFRYDYQYDASISKYFNAQKPFYASYDDLDLSKVPQSIAVIPFIAQVLPISWFAGFDVIVDELDEQFYHAMLQLKSAMLLQHGIDEHTIRSTLRVDRLCRNDKEASTRSLMLFSGGVDSITTYIKHLVESPDIATIHGADIATDDKVQWSQLQLMMDQSSLLAKAKKFVIESNLRTFYTHHVQFLLKDRAWWGKVQHGLGLTSLLAPIAYQFNYSRILIASTYSTNINIVWGSTIQTDNTICWGNTRVVHDASDLKRVDKIGLIIQYAKTSGYPIQLRVCFSSKNTGINCNHCEKCYRTIIALIIRQANPNDFGFTVAHHFYQEVLAFIKKGFYTEGEAYFWKELSEAIASTESFFYFNNNNKDVELGHIKQISQSIVDELSKGIQHVSKFTLFRQRVQLMFPRLTKTLIAVRNKL